MNKSKKEIINRGLGYGLDLTLPLQYINESICEGILSKIKREEAKGCAIGIFQNLSTITAETCCIVLFKDNDFVRIGQDDCELRWMRWSSINDLTLDSLYLMKTVHGRIVSAAMDTCTVEYIQSNIRHRDVFSSNQLYIKKIGSNYFRKGVVKNAFFINDKMFLENHSVKLTLINEDGSQIDFEGYVSSIGTEYMNVNHFDKSCNSWTCTYVDVQDIYTKKYILS